MKSNFTRPFFRRFALLFIALFVTIVSQAGAKAPKGRDITDAIYANPILTDFAKMLQASPDTYTFLSSRGPFTVFVPTDSAFAKLKPGELDSLLRPENKDRLVAILFFHIINGKRLAMRDLIPLHAMFSCEGNPLTFKQSHSGVFLVQKAKISNADIHCTNGNINEVDTVLMPPELALPALKATPVFAPAPAPSETNAVTTVPATGDTTNAAVPVIGNGPGAMPALSPH